MTLQTLIRVILEFPEAFIQSGAMDRFLALFRDWGDAFFGLPIRIPGFSTPVFVRTYFCVRICSMIVSYYPQSRLVVPI